jgi:hypothetical protein
MTAYMDGQDGAQGGPVFSGRQQPVSGDWWVWGYLPGEAPDGTLNANGSLNAAQKAVWSQLLPTAVASVACLMAGTQIKTPTGHSAIEDLNIDDLVEVYGRSPMKIKWIGIRNYYTKDVYKNPALRPIRIKAHSIQYNMPSLDLLISSKHAILINENLVPAECLLNGKFIYRDYSEDNLQYYHIELDTHEIIYANELLVESYIDHNNRTGFDNYNIYKSINIKNQIMKDNNRYERLNNGIYIIRISDSIYRRYFFINKKIYESFKITIDELNPSFVRGWAFRLNEPNMPLYLYALDGNDILGYAIAYEERVDVYAADAGPLNSGFQITFVKKLLDTKNVRVQQYKL